MIDFHSHILPAVDDGSADIDESLALLELLSGQGVDTVVATPHFYANHTSVEAFLTRRQDAYNQLKAAMPNSSPEILLGAEVRYYEGISRMRELRSLCIGDTRLLLLEMPMGHWTEYMVRELIDLACSTRIRLVLAHVERYYAAQDRSVWDRLRDSDVLLQVNASFFLGFGTRRRAVRMLDAGEIHLIGSDCHNLTDRKPQLDKAAAYIEKRLGAAFWEQMNEHTARLLLP
ncbi:MAG: hypothetical protein IJW62_07020 [Clostridia bacterium]|nr:hypothetical protein [Clostridia bacterium]